MIDEPGPPPSRTHVVSALADLLVNAVPDRVLRVAIDGPDAAVRTRYEARYLPAQELYQTCAAPREHADVLIDNEDPGNPLVLRWPA
ncbi:hypothetical protein [Frankia tisae]|uniref:hypothetical protein n=1 Tax=Frankia tisae TaxID=2950104 RepID=UPI0021C0595C|nr:hypothetical protein [Frankia tisae]